MDPSPSQFGWREDRVRWFAFAFLATLLAGATLGCSVSAPKKQAQTTATSAPEPQAPIDSERYLSLRDIRKAPSGSAASTVLRFWYAIQQRDLPLAYGLLSPPFIKSYAKSFRHFNDYILADYARWLVKPQIVAVATSRKNAKVVISYPTPGDPKARTTYDLRRLPDGWKITYEFYLVLRLTAKPQSKGHGGP